MSRVPHPFSLCEPLAGPFKKTKDQPEPRFVLARAARRPTPAALGQPSEFWVSPSHQQCLSRLPKPEFYRKGQFILPAKDVALSLAQLYLGRSLKCRIAVIKPDNPKIEPRPVALRHHAGGKKRQGGGDTAGITTGK